MDYMPEMHRKNSHNMRTSWKQIIRSKAQPQVKFNQIMAKSKLFNDNSAHYGRMSAMGLEPSTKDDYLTEKEKKQSLQDNSDALMWKSIQVKMSLLDNMCGEHGL